MGILNQPATNIKLTNVAVVRLKRGGKRFEIACYKNKVIEYRNQVEKDLDNVLQIPSVFLNVSKGQGKIVNLVASKQELVKAFETDDLNVIVKRILDKGELQVNEKERNQQLDHLNKDIAGIIAEKCINTETQRPFTASMIEKVLQDIHFSVNPNKNPKSQALEAIKLIQEKNIIPIKRVEMRVRLTINKCVLESLQPLIKIETQEKVEEMLDIVASIEPNQFKAVSALVKGHGKVQLLQ